MKKPIVLVIMDGVGRGDGGPGDAVKQANTPTLDNLMATCPMTWLKAHGTAVGLPTDDDMGNSEVGHNALGCGQIYSQGAKLVQESIESGSLYQSKTWIDLTDNCLQNGKALHFIGLLSDGNVHSNISHLIAMLKKAREMGLKKVYCHILLDGRDVPATSALDYVDQLESVLAELNDAEHEYKIASGGELARIMLAMKNVLSEQDHVGTMVFDEVDTGVSGRAAQKVAEGGNPHIAAISSHPCAELYGLECVKDDIQDSDNNYTRFFCVAKSPAIYPGANRISLVVGCDNRPGALYEILAKLSALGINMTKLESCPVTGRNFEFVFFLELEASVLEEGVLGMLEELERECATFHFLGNYAEI